MVECTGVLIYNHKSDAILISGISHVDIDLYYGCMDVMPLSEARLQIAL